MHVCSFHFFSLDTFTFFFVYLFVYLFIFSLINRHKKQSLNARISLARRSNKNPGVGPASATDVKVTSQILIQLSFWNRYSVITRH